VSKKVDLGEFPPGELVSARLSFALRPFASSPAHPRSTSSSVKIEIGH
jgi:hypothetical protein